MMRLHQADMPQSFPGKQKGAVLVTALVFLVILTMLGITSMTTNILEERMAANTQEVNRAFQAAESSIYTAFDSSTAFVGTKAGWEATGDDMSFGYYNAKSDHKSAFRLYAELPSYGDVGGVSDGALFANYFYTVTGTGTMNPSGTYGATATIVAGARKIGKKVN